MTIPPSAAPIRIISQKIGTTLIFVARGIETASDVGDASAGLVERDLKRAVLATQDHGDFVPAGSMMREGRSEREVGEDVAVIDDEWRIDDEVLDILDAARGFQNLRSFMPKCNGRVAIRGIRECCLPRLRAPMRIHDEPLDAGAKQVIERIGNERAIG